MLSAFADWKRDPFVGFVGVVSLVGVVAMGPYLWIRKLRYVVAEPGVFVWDFSYFYRAAARFVADPLTLYADPHFFYPPPSVLAFLPGLVLPETSAYVMAVVVNAGLMAGCGLLVVRLWERRAGPVSVGERWAAVLFALASAPTFQAMKYGQVGPLVLLSGLLALWWLDRWPARAGVALVVGFWLKLYPLALVPLGLLRRGRFRFAGGVALGIIALPLVLLPAIPATLYVDYVEERLPFVGSMTFTHALNQGLPAALERARRPDAAALDNRELVEIHAGVRHATVLVGLLLLAVVFIAVLRTRIGRVEAGYLVLALLPFLSNFGWEHTYVLAVPLAQAAFLTAAADPRWRWAGVAVVSCFLFPTLPRLLLEAVVGAGARPLTDILFMRLPLAAALAAAVLTSKPLATPGPHDRSTLSA